MLLPVQGPGFTSGRLPNFAGDTGMQQGYMPRMGNSSSGSLLSGSGSPQSLAAGRGISLPASLHSVKFGNEGVPAGPASAVLCNEQLPQPQESIVSEHGPVQYRSDGVADAASFDAHFLGSVPRSAPSSVESNIPRSQLRPPLQQEAFIASQDADLPQSLAHTAAGSVPLGSAFIDDGQEHTGPMTDMQDRQQNSAVAGEIPDRLSFLPRTVSVVTITRASSV